MLMVFGECLGVPFALFIIWFIGDRLCAVFDPEYDLYKKNLHRKGYGGGRY